jgi:hypothetical protein
LQPSSAFLRAGTRILGFVILVVVVLVIVVVVVALWRGPQAAGETAAIT